MNKWIVITGLDGSGKTTLKKDLAEYFKAFSFKLPHHNFVRELLDTIGGGNPMVDTHSDISLFVADGRATNYKIREWLRKNKLIISQRGWMDHYIFNKAQGLSYKKTHKLLRPEDLEKPSISIYLIADPSVAFKRIKNDVGDKYETLDFMKIQYKETKKFYNKINKNKKLRKFFGGPKILIDTTNLTNQQVFEKVKNFLEKINFNQNY